MKETGEHAKDLYATDQYIAKHPSLHEEDSPWKIAKILPLVDMCLKDINKDHINLLDVGGGAGLILNAVSVHIKQVHGIRVNKFALDLSPGMLDIQRENNPDLKKALNEDVRKTSLANKEIDITLMIDLLEHVPNPAEALEEATRISNFVILKVPLEDNLFLTIMNWIRKGKVRERLIKHFGHINVYSLGRLKQEIEKHMGQILEVHLTNVFDYYLKSERERNRSSYRRRLKCLVAAGLFRLSPRLCSVAFTDFVMLLVKCR
jgi:SAM-dependent methyltransferase